MKAGIIAFSEKGLALASRVGEYFDREADSVDIQRCEEGGLSEWAAAHFNSDDALIFIGSCGIAVRAIAPHVKSKVSDPAVLVIDDCATYVIALLSGHLGGANRLAAQLGRFLNAIPVITTATDRRGLPAIDTWAEEHGLAIANPGLIKRVSGRMLAGKPVRFRSEFPVMGRLPDGFELSESEYEVLITHRAEGREDVLRLVPAVLTLGVGCRRGVDADDIDEAFLHFMGNAGFQIMAVKLVCSIDLKTHEPGLLAFCRRRKLPFRTFTAEQLKSVPGSFSSSAFVELAAGVDNVCERSAVLGSGESGRLLVKKSTYSGVTLALAAGPAALCF